MKAVTDEFSYFELYGISPVVSISSLSLGIEVTIFPRKNNPCGGSDRLPFKPFLLKPRIGK